MPSSQSTKLVISYVQAAYQSGEDEVNLSTMGRTYTIDFNAMQQINEDTGTARPVQRKANPLATPGSAGPAGREGAAHHQPLSRTSTYNYCAHGSISGTHCVCTQWLFPLHGSFPAEVDPVVRCPVCAGVDE